MDDTISRAAALSALDVLCQEHRYRIPGKRETYSQYNEAWQDALDRAEGAIGNLPSAQPGWIPCSVTSPKNGGNYYVTQFRCDVYDPNMTGAYICETDYIWYSALRKRWFTNGNCKVVAWMPLPAPWEGGQDNGTEQ